MHPDSAIDSTHNIPCPNCGASAERCFITPQSLLRTQCGNCDYLLITCSRTGRVIESYAPGVCLRSRQHKNATLQKPKFEPEIRASLPCLVST
jgi:hypothetical protein